MTRSVLPNVLAAILASCLIDNGGGEPIGIVAVIQSPALEQREDRGDGGAQMAPENPIVVGGGGCASLANTCDVFEDMYVGGAMY